MVKILLEINDSTDRHLKYFMLEKSISNKKEAINYILQERFNK